MLDHPYLATVRAYYEGCNTGDLTLMKSTFTPDVKHYFPTHAPVQGAEVLAKYWQGFNTSERRTTWTVDHGLVVGDEAAIEWTMIVTFMDGRPQEILRGAEWYLFRNGKIAEIRAYYHSDPERKVTELIGYPYAERGFPTLSDR